MSVLVYITGQVCHKYSPFATVYRYKSPLYLNNFLTPITIIALVQNSRGMNAKLVRVLLHMLGCAVFLTLPQLLTPGPLSFDVFNNDYSARDLVANVLVLAFFYINFYFFIPRYYFNSRYVVYALLVFGCFLVVTLVPVGLITIHHRPEHFGPQPPDHGSILFEASHHIFLFLIVFFVSLLVKVNNQWKKTEREKLNTELSYLKAQINPHFLFNTLNSIYALAIEKSDYTATAVVKLAGMMRYVISEVSSDYVSLEKEVNYIVDYIELQKVRLGDTIDLNVKINGDVKGKKIAPLVLIPFIENAFKYGVNPEKSSPIDISLDMVGNVLIMMVNNHKVNTAVTLAEKNGLGIGNTRKRLNLLYPSRYILNITDDADIFQVHLTINLQ